MTAYNKREFRDLCTLAGIPRYRNQVTRGLAKQVHYNLIKTDKLCTQNQ